MPLLFPSLFSLYFYSFSYNSMSFFIPYLFVPSFLSSINSFTVSSLSSFVHLSLPIHFPFYLLIPFFVASFPITFSKIYSFLLFLTFHFYFLFTCILSFFFYLSSILSHYSLSSYFPSLFFHSFILCFGLLLPFFFYFSSSLVTSSSF